MGYEFRPPPPADTRFPDCLPVILSGMSTPGLSRVDERGGFSAGHSGLSLLNRGEHAFTQIQALPLHHAPIGGISELAHLDGELA
jgi:hypothetical protein